MTKCKKTKPETSFNPDNFEPVTMEEFEKAVKGVLLKPVRERAKYENREPTKKELETGYTLEKRRK